MPYFSDVYADPNGNTQLENYLAKVRTYLNSIDSMNIAENAGIPLTAIANGTLITAHASRHGAGGADPLPSSSISSSMIIPRAVQAHHLGIGSVMAEHFAKGTLAEVLYRDPSPQTYNDGDVIDPPTGYETDKMQVQVIGLNIQKDGAFDRVRLPIVWSAEPGEAVKCSVYAYDGSSTNKEVKGSLKVIRVCSK